MSLVNKIFKEGLELIPKTIVDGLRIASLRDMSKVNSDNVAKIYFINNSNEATTVKKVNEGIKNGCYYNAISYALKNDCDLAWGLLIKKESYDEYKEVCYYYTYEWKHPTEVVPRIDGIKHAFCVKNNIIIDPSPLVGGEMKYYYIIVPKEIWKTFNHKENDLDFNAEDFSNYVNSEYSKFYKKSNQWFKQLIK